MQKALDLDAGKYSWLLTIFYISYIVFQFQVLGWKRFPPHIWASWAIFGWYVSRLTACTSAADWVKGCDLDMPSCNNKLGWHDGSQVLAWCL